jgi:hypothetical protein
MLLTVTHTQNALLRFHYNNGYKNAPHCYVMRTSAILLEVKHVVLCETRNGAVGNVNQTTSMIDCKCQVSTFKIYTSLISPFQTHRW